MKTKPPRTWLYAIVVSLVAAVFVTVTGWLLASPSEEITSAISANGTRNVKQANANTFLDAFASVLVAVDKKGSTPYIAAAVKLRPDLKVQIAETATDIYSGADDEDAGSDRRVSGHRRRCKICHNGHTLTLPCKAARHHLQHHPGDTRGPCPPTPTPHA